MGKRPKKKTESNINDNEETNKNKNCAVVGSQSSNDAVSVARWNDKERPRWHVTFIWVSEAAWCSGQTLWEAHWLAFMCQPQVLWLSHLKQVRYFYQTFFCSLVEAFDDSLGVVLIILDKCHFCTEILDYFFSLEVFWGAWNVPTSFLRMKAATAFSAS